MMNKLQFWHHKDERGIHYNYTVACIQPHRFDLEVLEQQFEAGKDAILTISVGVAKLHPKDKNWRKSTGREVAEKNMKEENIKLAYIRKDQGFSYFTFLGSRGLIVKFLLSHDKNNAFMNQYFNVNN